MNPSRSTFPGLKHTSALSSPPYSGAPIYLSFAACPLMTALAHTFCAVSPTVPGLRIYNHLFHISIRVHYSHSKTD